MFIDVNTKKTFAVHALVYSSDDLMVSWLMIKLLFKLLCTFDCGPNIVYDVLFISRDQLLQHSHVYNS